MKTGKRKLLPRLSGAAQAASNIRIEREFGGLARTVAAKYGRLFRLSPEARQDLFHSILVELFKAPACYRNRAGVSLMLKHKMREIIRKAIKHEPETSPWYSRTPTGEISTVQMEHALVTRRLAVLTCSERVVLGLLFGLDGNDPFPVQRVAQKLGRPETWVRFKSETALQKLRQALRVQI